WHRKGNSTARSSGPALEATSGSGRHARQERGHLFPADPVKPFAVAADHGGEASSHVHGFARLLIVEVEEDVGLLGEDRAGAVDGAHQLATGAVDRADLACDDAPAVMTYDGDFSLAHSCLSASS